MATPIDVIELQEEYDYLRQNIMTSVSSADRLCAEHRMDQFLHTHYDHLYSIAIAKFASTSCHF